ncbi:MAG: C4-dicarboxylate ABC transporter, partial [Gemmobacter sp.]|nr:C4-dicarboxylate ABC transporter [Gemmobacter sp.]
KAENDAALARMRASGLTEFHELTEAERAAWIAALAPVQEAMAARIGQDTLDMVREAAAE